MDMLKKFFPFSFTSKPEVTNLVVALIIYLVAAFAAGIVLWICSWVPILNILAGIVGGIIELYVFIGIVLTVLDYCKVLK